VDGVHVCLWSVCGYVDLKIMFLALTPVSSNSV